MFFRFRRLLVLRCGCLAAGTFYHYTVLTGLTIVCCKLLFMLINLNFGTTKQSALKKNYFLFPLKLKQ